MKRNIRKTAADAWSVIVQDLKDSYIALLVIAAYLIIGRAVSISLCPMVSITGFPCPGCGLTRAFFLLITGHLKEAFVMNAMIYPIVILAAVFITERYLLLKNTRHLLKWCIILFAVMLIYYIYRMVVYFPGEPPMSYYYHAVFRLYPL